MAEVQAAGTASGSATVYPGSTLLIRMPSGATSSAHSLVQVVMAARATMEVGKRGEGSAGLAEEMLTMLPPPWARIGARARQARTTL